MRLESTKGIPAAVGNWVCVARTGTYLRRVPVYRTLLHRLLHHEREPASPPPPLFLRLTLNYRRIYSSTVAYIVDANPSSSSAVATNCIIPGVAPFVFTEGAFPPQDSLGVGGLHMLWVGILVP